MSLSAPHRVREWGWSRPLCVLRGGRRESPGPGHADHVRTMSEPSKTVATQRRPDSVSDKGISLPEDNVTPANYREQFQVRAGRLTAYAFAKVARVTVCLDSDRTVM